MQESTVGWPVANTEVEHIMLLIFCEHRSVHQSTNFKNKMHIIYATHAETASWFEKTVLNPVNNRKRGQALEKVKKCE